MQNFKFTYDVDRDGYLCSHQGDKSNLYVLADEVDPILTKQNTLREQCLNLYHNFRNVREKYDSAPPRQDDEYGQDFCIGMLKIVYGCLEQTMSENNRLKLLVKEKPTGTPSKLGAAMTKQYGQKESF